MPRSEAASSAPRAEQLRVRVSAAEAEAIGARAREAGARFSDYARHVLICGRVVTRERVRLPFALRRELERIGINLRQLRALDGPAEARFELRRVHGRLAAILRAELAALRPEGALPEEGGAALGIMRAVRLSADQRAVIEALARQADKSLSAYAREMLREGRVTVIRDREIAFAPLDELKALGVRINEAAHQANIDKRLPDALPFLLARLAPHLDLIAQD